MPGARSRLRRGVAAVAAVGAVSGVAFLSGAFDPLVRSALREPDEAGSSMQSVAQYSAGAAWDEWMTNDRRPEWGQQRLVPPGPQEPAARGRAGSLPGPQGPAAPAVQVPENPLGRNLFRTPAQRMRKYELQPMSSCFQPRGPQQALRSLDAQPAPGARGILVSWWDLGDPDTSSYTLDVVQVNPGPTEGTGVIRTVTVPAPGDCRTVVSQVDGLVSGYAYQVWVTATNTSTENGGRTYRAGRGQTPTVIAP